MKKFLSLLLCAGIMASMLSGLNVAYAACAHTSLGTLYSEADHPHKEFRYCTECYTKIYTGGKEVKKHGTGEWGSGTCPSCGSHTYVGRGCTSAGKCACGALISAYGHLYDSAVYFENAHPHKGYKTCRRCGGKQYTGDTKTFPHGDGTNSTCRSCGSHNYVNLKSYSITHPHKGTRSCACGATLELCTIRTTCSSCRENMKVAGATNSTTGVLSYIDSDGVTNLGAVIFAPITYNVTYTNHYNDPADNFPAGTVLPGFVSFDSTVTSDVTGQPAYTPTILTTSSTKVYYYDSNNNLVLTQDMDFRGGGVTGSKVDFLVTLAKTPAYATSSAICNVLGSSNSVTGTVKAYFN